MVNMMVHFIGSDHSQLVFLLTCFAANSITTLALFFPHDIGHWDTADIPTRKPPKWGLNIKPDVIKQIEVAG
jgi:hypothetical protein